MEASARTAPSRSQKLTRSFPNRNISSLHRPPSPVLVSRSEETPATVSLPVGVPTQIPVVDVPLREEDAEESAPLSQLRIKEGDFANLRVQNYGDLISEVSIESVLIEYGYVPKEKIIVKDQDGELVNHYIKAVNKLGQSVFVHIDVPGYTEILPQDPTMVQAESAVLLPYSIKLGLFQCAQLEICGIAFDCTDGVCTLVRDNTKTTPTETNFIHLEKAGDLAHSFLQNEHIAYPIIKLSEIKSAPDVILKSTDIVTNRIQQESYKISLAGLAECEHALSRLQVAFTEFEEIRKDITRNLDDSMNALRDVYEGYELKPPTFDTTRSRYREVQYNMRRRNELVGTLISCCRSVAEEKSNIDNISETLQGVIKYCGKEFAGIDSVLEDG